MQEAFDYIGSERMLYDMSEGEFPHLLARESDRDEALHRIRPQHIGWYIELSQLGRSEDDALWLHTDPISRQNATVDGQVCV